MYLTTDPFSSVMAFPANTCSTDPGTGKGVPTFTILTDRNSETLSGSSPTVDAGDSILPQQQESIGCIEKSFLLLNQFTGNGFCICNGKYLVPVIVHTIQNPQRMKM